MTGELVMGTVTTQVRSNATQLSLKTTSVDTAGTITKAADLLLSQGARSVRALASHPVMSDPATERVLASGLTEIIFTDSIPYGKDDTKVVMLPVAKLFADTIRRIHNNQSISSQYLFK